MLLSAEQMERTQQYLATHPTDRMVSLLFVIAICLFGSITFFSEWKTWSSRIDLFTAIGMILAAIAFAFLL